MYKAILKTNNTLSWSVFFKWNKKYIRRPMFMHLFLYVIYCVRQIRPNYLLLLCLIYNKYFNYFLSFHLFSPSVINIKLIRWCLHTEFYWYTHMIILNKHLCELPFEYICVHVYIKLYVNTHLNENVPWCAKCDLTNPPSSLHRTNSRLNPTHVLFINCIRWMAICCILVCYGTVQLDVPI